MKIEAYCVKCKQKRPMMNPVESLSSNHKPLTKGECPICGTKMCRIGRVAK